MLYQEWYLDKAIYYITYVYNYFAFVSLSTWNRQLMHAYHGMFSITILLPYNYTNVYYVYNYSLKIM